ncbi:MAG: UDP-N-acetylmuramate dehydrogenase [Thermincola sp.]|jgi:UDP-N-acetylmuramate dehydrogenase|nr:UDP-N-acetylmuramate dehydrogenase [Thermincola sp.]MDT3701588.1 UDP-N-acetylmuramate dehydrogenase [Thermincola sp.]
MDLREVKHELGDLIQGVVTVNENMKKHTTWRIGGPADIMVLPTGTEDIRKCLVYAQERKLPLTVIGNGSNLLVRDKGIRGIVLKMGKSFSDIYIEKNTIRAEAGAFIPLVAREAAEAGLSGLEFAAGIPASVGGAVRMNAGAHGKCIDQVVQMVTVLNPDGSLETLSNGDIGFKYRQSNIKERGLIVVEAVFSLVSGRKSEIKAKNGENLAKRKLSQPLEYPNAGSVFANPPGQWAGWLIEQVGGKGMCVGNAMVSEKHANFIVNLGDAAAEDVLRLIEKIKKLVFEQFNIDLKLEVQVVGE